MSYILEALRKSETERRQGKAPDLGQQVQMVYQPKKKPVPLLFWIGGALVLNAAVMVWLFWPSVRSAETIAGHQQAAAVIREAEQVPAKVVRPEPEQAARKALTGNPVNTEPEAPLVIVPGPTGNGSRVAVPESSGRVPHLVELPLSLQKGLPDLTFNSHIFASDPAASRVMINNHYLRPGDRFGELSVVEITEDGVVLRKDKHTFRVGTVRDWVSPR